MREKAKTHPITIDLNQFELRIALKIRSELTLYFNSPSRRFYLAVIALVIYEMKRQGKITSIPLEKHHNLLALLNDTIGGSAGSSEEENLLSRVYKKWKYALPNLEEAPLFTVLGRKKGYEEGVGKTYLFTEAEKDNWANLFEYKGSHENVRLKFAVDKIGATLDDVVIVFGDSLNAKAWEKFISSLKDGRKEETQPVEEPAEPIPIPEPTVALIPPPLERKISWVSRYRRAAMVVGIVVVLGAIALAIWKSYLRSDRNDVASIKKMAFPLPDKPSIAVLPFVNMSEDPKQEYFSDGMTEDIITDLSKISGLMVIARNSTFTYKGKPLKNKQVAEELGVRYLLEGSVQKSGDIIRINAQLIDAIDGHHLWAERYDGKMDWVFALQDQITQKIVSALRVKLTGGEREQLGQRGTDNIDAYNALLEGYGEFFRYTPDGTAKAAAFFKKAIELDSNYGRAYAGLADVYYQATLFQVLLTKLNMSWIEGRLRFREYAQMAMKKPIPYAYALSALLYLSRRQHKKAISELEQALALDPNSTYCLFDMGRVLYLAGRPKEGIEYLNKSWRLDPRSRFLYLVALSWAHFCMGETAEAATLIEQAVRLNPEGGPPIQLASFYAALGRDRDARGIVEMRRKKLGAAPDMGVTQFNMPFRDRATVDRYAQGLLKAGLAPARISGGYFPASKENQLTGEEIKNLLLGSKITGIDQDGQQWWVNRKKDGEFTWRGPALKDPVTRKIISAPTLAGPNSDRGKSWMEGDAICHQFEKLYWGLEFCGTVFRNPRGTNGSKDEYFFCNDIGFTPFSLVR